LGLFESVFFGNLQNDISTFTVQYGNLAQTYQIIINSTIGIADRQRFDADPDPVPKRPFNSDVK
jgi:hypothetical protein